MGVHGLGSPPCQNAAGLKLWGRPCPVLSRYGSPRKLYIRTITARSKVDLHRLSELSLPMTTNAMTPLFQVGGGGKDLGLVIKVLPLTGEYTHVSRALVDTGGKVPVIGGNGILQATSPSMSPLRLITADGTPTKGGRSGCPATLQVRRAVSFGWGLWTSWLSIRGRWVYEVEIDPAEMITRSPTFVPWKWCLSCQSG